MMCRPTAQWFHLCGLCPEAERRLAGAGFEDPAPAGLSWAPRQWPQDEEPPPAGAGGGGGTTVR
jgi:hypothetical protein